MKFGKCTGIVLGGIVALGTASSAVAETQYNLAGPAFSISSDSGSWSWQGAFLLDFRNALTDTSNFGAGGTVEVSLNLFDVTEIDATSLAGIDGFISPWWFETDMPAGSVETLRNFFFAGGDLYLLQDDFDTDGLGAALGLPTSESTGSDSNGDGPLLDGPFGVASNVRQSGNVGKLDEATVLSLGGHVGAKNAEGEVTAAYWDEGEFAPGAGRLVIIADIDMIASEATYTPLNDNGIFALNAMAFLVGGNIVSPNPEPDPTPTPIPLPAGAWMALSTLGMLGAGYKLRARKA
jgi:hypothetical protein